MRRRMFIIITRSLIRCFVCSHYPRHYHYCVLYYDCSSSPLFFDIFVLLFVLLFSFGSCVFFLHFLRVSSALRGRTGQTGTVRNLLGLARLPHSSSHRASQHCDRVPKARNRTAGFHPLEPSLLAEAGGHAMRAR